MVQDRMYSDLSIINVESKTEKSFPSSGQKGSAGTFPDKVGHEGESII